MSTLWTAKTCVDSPLGSILLAATPRGLAGLWFDGQKHHPGEVGAPTDAQNPHLRAAAHWLTSYWDGVWLTDPQAVQVLPALDPQGSAFQQRVWLALRTIPLARTITYGTLAAQLGHPNAARAVGAAVGRNPLSILVPCHRVVGASGKLTGYAGGLDRKQHLLHLESTMKPKPHLLKPSD
jgi:methylated-DNA-[protein]-cysteine S-methyltransferase